MSRCQAMHAINATFSQKLRIHPRLSFCVSLLQPHSLRNHLWLKENKHSSPTPANSPLRPVIGCQRGRKKIMVNFCGVLEVYFLTFYCQKSYLKSCSMNIFSKFPTVNTSKLNFWLVLCIANTLFWTTLRAIFSIF